MNEECRKNIRILIVDDTPENIRVAAGMLSKQGYQIAFDDNAGKALCSASEK